MELQYIRTIKLSRTIRPKIIIFLYKQHNKLQLKSLKSNEQHRPHQSHQGCSWATCSASLLFRPNSPAEYAVFIECACMRVQLYKPQIPRFCMHVQHNFLNHKIFYKNCMFSFLSSKMAVRTGCSVNQLTWSKSTSDSNTPVKLYHWSTFYTP